MPVTVRTGAVLRSLLGGQKEIEAAGNSVGELLKGLGVYDRICDDAGKVRRHFNIHVNEGEDIRLLDGFGTAVSDGDTVTILSAIAGGARTTRKLWLTYPKELVDRPLIWELGREFSVVTNIRQASLKRDFGLVGLEVSGDEDEVRRAIAFLDAQGVSVEPVELDIVE